MTKHDFTRLVILQFAIYAALCIMAFIAWAVAFTQNTSLLEAIVGEYLRGHFLRWITKFPLWGVSILVSGALSIGTLQLLWNSRKEGAYVGVVAFSIGFITNIVFAQNLLVHTLIGLFIGWTLLAPLAFLWKTLE